MADVVLKELYQEGQRAYVNGAYNAAFVLMEKARELAPTNPMPIIWGYKAALQKNRVAMETSVDFASHMRLETAWLNLMKQHVFPQYPALKMAIDPVYVDMSAVQGQYKAAEGEEEQRVRYAMAAMRSRVVEAIEGWQATQNK